MTDRRPRSRLAVLAAAVVPAGILVAGCGHLWQTTTRPVPAPARDVSACAIAQATSMGYKVVVDTVHREQRDVEATKGLSQKAQGADALEFTRRDVISIILSGAGDGQSSMRVVAGTISIEETRRGPTDTHEPASYDVLADADSLIARCGVANPPGAKS